MIRHSLFNIPDTYYPAWPYQSRALLCIFQQCFKVYLTDVVKNEVDEGSRSDDLALCNRLDDRQSSLVLWKKQVHPLAYVDNAYTHLLRTVNNNPGLIGKGLPASYHGQKSIAWFAEQALHAVIKNNTRIVPPFWKSGHSFLVFKMAVQEAERLIGSAVDHPPTRATILEFITKAASLAKVCNIYPLEPQSHRCSRQTSNNSHTYNVGQPWTSHSCSLQPTH